MRRTAAHLADGILGMESAASASARRSRPATDLTDLVALVDEIDRLGALLQEMSIELAALREEYRKLLDRAERAGLDVERWDVVEPWGVVEPDVAMARRRELAPIRSAAERLRNRDSRLRRDVQTTFDDACRTVTAVGHAARARTLA